MPIHVTHHNDFTPLQRECIDGYFAGHTSDKELSSHLGISIAALRSRLNCLWHHAGMPFGSRRDQAMLILWHQGLIDIKRQSAEAIRNAALLLLCVLSACGGLDDQARVRTRTKSGTLSASMLRAASRTEYTIGPDPERTA